MEHRSLQVVAGLIAVLAVLGGNAWAVAGPEPEQRADWERRLASSKEMQKRGKSLHQAALARFESEKSACFKKFRVNDCQSEAKQRYAVALKESRRVENEGKALERQVKKEELADKDARRLEDAPRREADLKARQATTAADREAADTNRGERQVDKEAKAAEGERRHIANDERIRDKRAKHDRKVAEKMEKARRREAEQAD